MTVHVFYSSDHPTRCPGCDTQLSGHLRIPKELRPKPESGAVTVCPNCAQCMIFTEKNGRLALRRPTEKERDLLLQDPEITAEMFIWQVRENDITGGYKERG